MGIWNDIKEREEKDKKATPKAQYNYKKYGALIYLAVALVLIILFGVLMDRDPKGNLPVGIVLLVLFVLLTIGFLVAGYVIRKKSLKTTEVKEGSKHPARIVFSLEMYNDFRNTVAKTVVEKGNMDMFKFFMADMLMNGNLTCAKVMSTDPFIVAVYDDIFDGVLLLTFPQEIVLRHDLKAGDRLVATDCYYERAFPNQGIDKDILPGQDYFAKWKDLCPLIPLFFTADTDALKDKEKEFSDEEWKYAEEMMEDKYFKDRGNTRNGLWFAVPSEERWNYDPFHDAKLD